MISYKYPNLRRGLVGSWCPSQGQSGSRLIDRSGYGNHGTLTSMDAATDWVADGGKLALDFDGSNDHVNCGTTLSIGANSLSVSLWLKSSATGIYLGLISKTTNGAEGAAEVGWYIGNYGFTTGRFINCINDGTNAFQLRADYGSQHDGNWHHIAVVFDRSGAAKCEVYIDGIPRKTGTVGTMPTGSIDAASKSVLIAKLDTAGNYWPGRQDSINIYNRALGYSEVQTLRLRRGIEHETSVMQYVKGAAAPSGNRRRRYLLGVNG